MAEINKVIEAILRDVLDARASVDLISKDLVRQYAGDDVLKYFNIPKVNLSSMEFEIKYAVDSVENVPMNSSESIKKKSALIENFCKNTSKALQNSFSKLSAENPLYQSLGNNFPSDGWRKNIEEIIRKEITAVASNENESTDTLITKSKNSISKQIESMVPIAKQMEGFYVIPNNSGNFEIISLSEKKEIDLKIGAEFKDEAQASSTLNSLLSALKANTAVVGTINRDLSNKVDKTEVIVGDQKIPVESTEFMNVAKADPKGFTGMLKEKEKPVSFKNLPWLTGSIMAKTTLAPSSITTANVKPVNDLSFSKNAETIFGKEFENLKFELEKLKVETSKPLINVELETQKLKEVDPTKLLTLRFSVDMKDFSITDEDQPTPIN